MLNEKQIKQQNQFVFLQEMKKKSGIQFQVKFQ